MGRRTKPVSGPAPVTGRELEWRIHLLCREPAVEADGCPQLARIRAERDRLEKRNLSAAEKFEALVELAAEVWPSRAQAALDATWGEQ